MIVITRNQNNCDHVFSFTTQDGVHVFKCELCGAEHQFANENSPVENSTIDSPL